MYTWGKLLLLWMLAAIVGRALYDTSKYTYSLWRDCWHGITTETNSVDQLCPACGFELIDSAGQPMRCPQHGRFTITVKRRKDGTIVSTVMSNEQ